MCGRYTLKSDARELAKLFDVAEVPSVSARFNIAPSQEVAAVRIVEGGEEREMSMLRWGLIPSWAKDPKVGHKLINARAETVAEKPSFREAFRRRRCLIVADGFFEFEKLRGGAKQPHYFRLRDGRPFAFAGLYERWRGEDGEVVDSCAILTTEACDLVRQIHPRMPVILHPSDHDLWLDRDVRKTELLTELFAPYPAEEMASHPVSTLVNRPTIDTAEIIEPA